MKASSNLLDHLSSKDDLRELIHPQRVDFFLRLVILCLLGVVGLTAIRHAVEFLSTVVEAFTEVPAHDSPLKLLIANQRGMIHESGHISPFAE